MLSGRMARGKAMKRTETIETKYTFETVEARDLFIARNYPERKCMNVPGCYKVPGGTLQVSFLDVYVYRKGGENVNS